MESWLKKDLQRAPGIRRMTALQLVDKSADPALAGSVDRRQVVGAGVGEEEVADAVRAACWRSLVVLAHAQVPWAVGDCGAVMACFCLAIV